MSPGVSIREQRTLSSPHTHGKSTESSKIQGINFFELILNVILPDIEWLSEGGSIELILKLSQECFTAKCINP